VFHKVISAARVMRENASASGLVQQKELRYFAVRVKGMAGLDKFDDVARNSSFRRYREMISNNSDDG
jgi:tellurite resistance protein